MVGTLILETVTILVSNLRQVLGTLWEGGQYVRWAIGMVGRCDITASPISFVLQKTRCDPKVTVLGLIVTCIYREVE
jgi:hypothetical protein